MLAYIQNLFYLQLVFCCVAAVIRVSVHHHGPDYIFSGLLGSLSLSWISLKIEFC